MKYTINMLSSAHKVKGHGVLSAYNEQVSLVSENLSDKFCIYENKVKFANIMHYHTINFKFFLTQPFAKIKGKTVGYVHFLPETLENSLKLPKIIKPLFYKYVIQFYKNMDYLIVVNPYFINVLEKYGIDKKKVIYIPNYVCDKQFYPVNNEKKNQIRKMYNIDKDKFVVFCAGQLQVRKGIFEFIEIAERMPDIEFVWAGGFSFGNITNGYEKIKKKIENKPNNLHFIGMIDRENMNDVYNMADIMFLPSFEELFPMTILESMNCQKPILLRDLEIYKDILFDFYEKGSSIDDFIDIIKKLKSDPDYYNNAVQNSKKGSEFYHKDHVLAIWDKFYTDIVKDNKNNIN